MRIPTPLTLVLLTLLAAATWWLARPDVVGPAAPTAVAQPGYYLTAAQLEQTDATGRLTLKVRAATARQLQQGAVVRLEQIRLDYLPSPGRDWQMTSVGGTLFPDGKTVLLAGDVRLSAPDEGAAVVHTQHLTLNVDDQLASTADPVRIEMPPNTVNALGMQADLKRETLQLESNVNGTFSR
jgi:lipopolysaccharide export system protein LptC